MQTILAFWQNLNPVWKRVGLKLLVGGLGYLVHTGKVTLPPFAWDALDDPGLALVLGGLAIPSRPAPAA